MTGMLLISAFAATLVGILVFRRLATQTGRLLDVPNERSSHKNPVLRGAGIVIVLSVLGHYSVTFGLTANLTFIGAASVIAVIGFIDDLVSLPLIPRLFAHFATAAILVYSTGVPEELRIPLSGIAIPFGQAGSAMFVFFIVWSTNAYNFMDGIDGIAGSQGAAAGFGWMLFGIWSDQPQLTSLGAVILGSCTGFLLFNWSPASIFMGDVGSTFLGFVLASAPLLVRAETSRANSEAFLLAVAFLWPFLFDSIFTRLRQIFKRKAFWKPHREHLYQRLVISGTSHASVASFFGLSGLFISSIAAAGSKMGIVLAILLIVAFPIVLLFWVRKKEIDVN